jgi:hypothetical protein
VVTRRYHCLYQCFIRVPSVAGKETDMKTTTWVLVVDLLYAAAIGAAAMWMLL